MPGIEVMQSQRRQMLFRALSLMPAAGIGIAIYVIYQVSFSPIARVKETNRTAWEATFTERGLTPPAEGPRENHPQVETEPTPNDHLGWLERDVSVPGIAEIDHLGFQHYRPQSPAEWRLLIIGGSVAWGASASCIERTYFHVIGAELEQRRCPARIRVIAAGGWKSIQDLRALEIHGPRMQPDLVVFLNGLNDVTNGATFDRLHGGASMDTLNGADLASEDIPLNRHHHDYQERADLYLDNMQRAADLTQTMGSKMLVVLQPSLFERRNLSEAEQLIYLYALPAYGPLASVLKCYEDMIEGLRKLAEQQHVFFLDCSRVFDQERKTTFTDPWHFSDPGHQMLGTRMAAVIHAILQEVAERQQPNGDRSID